ncbi:MAG: T9SS type A sorting domain-containing protein [Bacteroidales bacterium]|nr:T9SS type A sorting domain-containing protein [Bacteroidales bacterium]
MRRYYLFFLAFIAGVCMTASAQVNVSVTMTDNTSQSHTIGQSGGIYFNNGTMTVRSGMTSNDEVSYTTSNIRSMVFSEMTAINRTMSVSQIRLFPNPTNGVFTVNGIGDEQQSMTIYNMLGKIVKSQPCSNGTHIDISEQPKGVYIVRIGNQTIKIVKQ